MSNKTFIYIPNDRITRVSFQVCFCTFFEHKISKQKFTYRFIQDINRKASTVT